MQMTQALASVQSASPNFPAGPTRQRATAFRSIDPLQDDHPTDEQVVLSSRALCRLATVASEVGARFVRERVKVDPVAWLYAPRALFDGSAAIQACVQLSPFRRAMTFHGLSLGLDAPAEEIDALIHGGEREREDDLAAQPILLRPAGASGGAGKTLYTATVVDETANGTLHAFVAMLAFDEDEVASTLRERYGSRIADQALIRAGFDAGEPIAMALVSEAVGDALRLVGECAHTPMAAGLDIQLESRFLH